ncbi:cyclic nucleotide-binding domain-containing protein [Pseudomonas sp. 2848]|uniref:cyclic nucleotide-binding domain-containing protein n=1 Tax=Pseudomonas sp. 2848 TaxID=2183926 RepID=UPI0035325DB4
MCELPPTHSEPLRSLCNECRVNGLCLPTGLPHDGSCLSALISPRIRIRKGAALFNANAPLTSLYALHSGSFKTHLNNAEGEGVVINFWMPGDVLGLDAIATEHHVCDAIALEDSLVCPIPYHPLQTLARDFPILQQRLNRLMSREIIREHERVLMICNSSADQRLASFLQGLSVRFVSRGYSSHRFILRMSREDIASYLGLRLETICRSVARLRALRIVTLHGRLVEILDMQALIALGLGSPGGHSIAPVPA